MSLLALALLLQRPEWDQQKAVERVKGVLALEEKEGRPWDKIAWAKDADEAVAHALKENKPLFVYFFVNKGGPGAAPC